MGGRIARTALLASGLLAVTGSASAQDRPTLQRSDYGQWETLGAYELDPTGRWLAVGIRRQDESVEVRVWDSSADVRYMVLPERPAGTESLGESELGELVTRDSMIGVAKARSPAAVA